MNIDKNIAISESGFVFNPATGESYNVNPLGADILSLLKQGKDYTEIQESIIEKYDVSPETFEKDYQDFTDMLKQYHLTSND